MKPAYISPEDDWLCHNGNIHYARNRSDFESYQPIDTNKKPLFAKLEGTNIEVPVLGIGEVRLHLKQRPGSQDDLHSILYRVHHIPSAMCNGISLKDLSRVGC